MLFDSICFGDVYKERLDIFYLTQRGQTPRRRQAQGNADLAKTRRKKSRETKELFICVGYLTSIYYLFRFLVL